MQGALIRLWGISTDCTRLLFQIPSFFEISLLHCRFSVTNTICLTITECIQSRIKSVFCNWVVEGGITVSHLVCNLGMLHVIWADCIQMVICQRWLRPVGYREYSELPLAISELTSVHRKDYGIQHSLMGENRYLAIIIVLEWTCPMITVSQEVWCHQTRIFQELALPQSALIIRIANMM